MPWQNIIQENLGCTFSADQVIVGVGSKSLLYAAIQSIEGRCTAPETFMGFL